MSSVSLTFPDGNVREFPKGVTAEQVAESISNSLKKKAVAGKVNGALYDLTRPIDADASIEIVVQDSEDGLEIMRHSCAHLLAQALRRIYPDVKLGIGPVIKNGFYYDVEMEHSLSKEDFPKIEKEMKKIVSENLPIVRKEVSRSEAIDLFKKLDDHLKLELIRDLPEDATITIYSQGDYVDLCRGPHLPSTGKIKAFKLMNVSGAYWRGDSDNEMLQRIYGVAFLKQKDLDAHLHFLEEAAKRDHRKLGKQLELFMFSEEAPGMPFYLPNGQIIRTELENFSRELQRQVDYDEVRTPLMMNQRLWENSGHWDHYHENMYFTKVDDVNYALKPMNCPGHMLIYKDDLHSYRDLPIRIAEFGQVHRHELSGALNGMLRVRTFCQDDAHIFVRPDQIESEIKNIFQLISKIYQTFGFEYTVELSTMPEDHMGSLEMWQQAEAGLKRVLEAINQPYMINAGDGAFYGPKIDFHIKDAIGREHQCATIQLDYQMPEKFDLTYVDENNEKVRPVVIHRAVYGSLDRFFAILIEHFAGAFPTWLAPTQVEVIPVADVHIDHVKKLVTDLKKVGIRAHADLRGEKLGYKIRDVQTHKIPYALVIGDQEIAQNAVNVRKYGQQETNTVAYDEFKANILAEIKNRVTKVPQA
ncbi:threonine--tRNA ligase [Sporolactobacillus terrae]|uniref:Threonine--tRNA ligase n=1 Tax=Sporolactobacillus terrae TaxID=269673 RepID=A0ABX5Q988_9BACL|nr:threonine--tRNA ligase [Sporolactobacillus terrae]QAA23172.1 threonine--tRNA ligase [Sporolactobacillus terrae]QAA26142.1 threonine--tRNA ligase [Sporolactobacillus terrae]UAK15238.1 threonine--tRNA ligase [Sporolactobacillus terrae]